MQLEIQCKDRHACCHDEFTIMGIICRHIRNLSMFVCNLICFQPRDGEPKIRVLHQEPIHVVDNHFSLPLGKTDQLKAPEHFPPAVQRYTLREMSLVWYMYGGSDFSTLKSWFIVLFI